MKKTTGVLSALIGAVLVSSITLNVCLYRAFIAEKQIRAKIVSLNRKKAARSHKNKKTLPEKKTVSRSLQVEETGRYGFKSVYVRLHGNENQTLVNLDREMISIQPALPFKLRSESWYNHILIDADFQPETVYSFLVRKGLKNENDASLQYDAAFKIRFPALPTSLKVLSGGLIFPQKRAARILPLELCNTDEIRVTVLRLYENNLLRFSTQSDWNGNVKALKYGKEIGSKTVPVRIPRNKKMSYALELDALLPAGQPGVYGLILTPSERKKTGNPVQLAVAVTDLAPQCAIDPLNRQVFAAVHRLSDGTACAGAEVTLVSSKYQTLASGVTDASGLVRLDYRGSAAGNDPEDYPNALLVKQGQDVVFQQDLFYGGHSLAEFPSGGNPVSADPRALVYAERGVYRPGEKVFVTAWVRNSDLKVCADAPCLLKIQDPAGNVIYSRKMKTSADGVIHASFALPEDIPGGGYTVWCQAPDESCVWGTADFLAADFVPDRLKVQLKALKPELTAADPDGEFSFSAEYYFGGRLKAPPYQFTVVGSLAPDRPEWKEWTIGSKVFTAGKGFSRSGRLNQDDKKIVYPGFEKLGGQAYRPVRLSAAVRVSEPGGRAVTAHAPVIYHPTSHYLGLKQESERDETVVRWKFFPASKNSGALPANQKIELAIFRSEWKYVLKKKQNRITREWVEEKVPVGREVIETASSGNGIWRRKLPGGCYEITAVCGKMRTDLKFWHWYGEGGLRSANPSVLSCVMDKEIYRPGETAKVTLDSRFDGIVLAVVGDWKLESCRSYPVQKGRNELLIKLPDNARSSSCYAGITLVSGEQRQFGLIRFKLDQNRHRLMVALESPENAVPGAKLKVRVKLSDSAGQPQNGIVQLYAVDEGILALTGYSTPDIFRFFYGVSGCEFIFTDIYGMLYPDLKIGSDGRIGGDAASPQGVPASLRNRLRDVRQSAPESAVVVLPPVSVSGSAEIELNLPDHLGAMRLIAVASSADRVGSAERKVKMRDKIGLLTTVPQVCAPGDETDVTFTMFNHDQPAGKMELTLEIPGRPPRSEIRIAGQGQSADVTFRVKVPDREGIFSFAAVLKKDRLVKRVTVKIPVRLPNPVTTHTVLQAVKPGAKWTSADAAAPEFASDAEYLLSVSGAGAAVLKDAVDWLNGYPYGCLEQTVSGAFPFLCADSLEKCGVITPEMARTAKVKANLAAAGILSMMLYNGAFPMWSGSSAEWSGGTVYAAHFLTASGSLRSSRQKNLLAGYLKTLLQNASASRYERAYAGYVLALMKERKTEILSGTRNVLKSKEDDFAAFLAAAALLEAGYSGEAWPQVKRLLEKEVWREDNSAPHFSGLAARAGMTLYILMQQQADAPEAVAKLRHVLLREIRKDGTGWGVTHANAWAVLGLAELERHSGSTKGSVRITFPDGKQSRPDLKTNPSFKLKDRGPVTVENTGSSLIYVQYRIKGVPVRAESLRSALRVQRDILRKDGKAVHSAKQGELLTVRLRLETAGAVRDVVLSDLLPGGLEIEDERFATRTKGADPEPRPQRKTNLTVKQVEKRPGEFVLSGDLHGHDSAEITYRVRAVSRGSFAAGSTSAEAMYDPGIRAFEPGNGVFKIE